MSTSQAQASAAHVPLIPTVFDEKASELARTYAAALLNAAEKSGQAEEVLEELEAIRDFVLSRFPTFAVMMSSPVRTSADKDRIITQAFEGRVLPTCVRFLRVLNRHDRLNILGPVLVEARTLWERRQNRRAVVVRSARPLTDEQQAALRDKMARLLNCVPVLRLETDPGLIGGFVVQVGDDVYDASIRKSLEQLRQRLLEGKTHEIQSRRDHFSHPE